MRTFENVLFITLSFTDIFFFKLGNAEFTVFHALFLLYLVVILPAIKISKINMPKFFSVLMVYIVFVNLLNISNVKLTSFLYTIIISIEIFLLYNLVQRTNLLALRKTLNLILKLFSINIIITSIFILVNYYPKGLIALIFQIYIDPTGAVRPYAFSNEPSYTSVLIVFVLFAFFILDGSKFNKKNVYNYVLPFIAIILIKSALGYVFFIVFLIYALNKSGYINLNIAKSLIIIFLFSLLLPIIFYFTKLNENNAVLRITQIGNSFVNTTGTLENKIDAIRFVDGSASMRLFPVFSLIEHYKSCKTINIIFGYGAGKSETFFENELEMEGIRLGFIPSFVYNYGVLGTIIAILFFKNLFPKGRIIIFVLFILFCFNADFNTQIFTFLLFVAMLIKKIDSSKAYNNKIIYLPNKLILEKY